VAEFEDPRQAWDARYRTEEYIFGTDPNDFLVSQQAHFPAGSHVLAVADGEGRNSVWLAERGCWVQAVDISPIAVEKARCLAASRGVGVGFEVADLMQWDWPEAAFDAVICIFIQFASPRMRQSLFDGFWRTLKPGGVLVMEGYGVKQMQYSSGGPGKIENLYTEAMLREAFRRWEILHLVERESILDEGPKHRGMAALVDLVARRPTVAMPR
jgi:ubiquinone/menaquinone biosynthesis C-methylase UbiE